jgi:hypothetical protein
LPLVISIGHLLCLWPFQLQSGYLWSPDPTSLVQTSARVLKILFHFIILTLHSVLGPPAFNLLVQPSGLYLPIQLSGLQPPSSGLRLSSLRPLFHMLYLPAVMQTG